MTPLQAIAVGVAGVWLVCAVLLARSGVRAAAILVAAAAVLLGVRQALTGESAAGVENVLWLVVWPLAIITYPRAQGHRPDIAAGVTVVGSGAVALVVPAVEALVTAGAIVVLTLLAHLWWRFERFSPVERIPLTWLVIGLGVSALAGFTTGFVAPGSAELDDVALMALAAPAVAMVVGVRFTGAVDVRGIVVEAAVLGVAAGTCFALYSTAVNGLLLVTGAVPDIGIQGILAAGVALAFHPLRRVLRSTLDELLFGRRPDPIAAAVEVAGGPLSDPTVVLERIREAMVLPYAALRVGTEIEATSGEPTPALRSFPLDRADTPLDRADTCLVVGLRPGDLVFSRADAQVLALVARLLGQNRRAEALAADLTRSRAAIRGAVEEERRRLRRDLHDGLGPLLTGMALTVDAVANLAAEASPQVTELLTGLREETSRAIDTVRRIAYEIRPPALDRLGLRGAIAHQAEALHRPGLRLDVVVPPDLGTLPAAVEVAAFRIVTEALANAVRHTTAQRIGADLAVVDGRLRIRVRDDQVAADDAPDRPWPAGVGLTSMRERVEELGGSRRAGPTADGGLVEAVLPIGL